jgi:hypothetical protein
MTHRIKATVGGEIIADGITFCLMVHEFPVCREYCKPSLMLKFDPQCSRLILN